MILPNQCQLWCFGRPLWLGASAHVCDGCVGLHTVMLAGAVNAVLVQLHMASIVRWFLLIYVTAEHASAARQYK